MESKPIDLFTVLETKQLGQLLLDTETMINLIFVLCREEVAEQFDLVKYDE
jgi:hypothetical protein